MFRAQPVSNRQQYFIFPPWNAQLSSNPQGCLLASSNPESHRTHSAYTLHTPTSLARSMRTGVGKWRDKIRAACSSLKPKRLVTEPGRKFDSQV